MKLFNSGKLVLITTFLLGCATTVYPQQVQDGYRTVSNYLEDFSDKSETLIPKTIPPDWTRMEDINGNVSYSATSYKGGYKGRAIGNIRSQVNVRSGNNVVDYYDYIISPKVKGCIKFWIARYSTNAIPQIEVYRMTKTENGFSCNPKTDLLFSVSDSAWPEHTSAISVGWVEQKFNIENYVYLGFRISNAYIDEFQASYAIVPGVDDSSSDNGTVSEDITQNSTNITGSENLAANGTALEYNSGFVSKKAETTEFRNKELQNNPNKQSHETMPLAVTPYFTDKTLCMVTDPSPNRFSQVTDNVFAIYRDGCYEFWTITGEKLYDAIWKSPKDYSSEPPQFNGGVVAMRLAHPNATGVKPLCLLYLDGSVKELDPSWEYVSKFEDGLALAKDEQSDWFYINTSGQKMYPDLTVYSPSDDKIRPLRDGLRAFYGTVEKYGKSSWGFIDTLGNVVITPKYKYVTDFSEGYAWVVTDDYKNGIYAKELIDVKGNVVCKLDDYRTGTSDVTDGVFREVNKESNIYRNPSGKVLASFHEATPFYDGYAFILTQSLGGNVSVIDRNFQIIRELPNDVLPPSGLERVKFTPYGLATINRSNIIAPNGNLTITGNGTGFENTIGSFGRFSESGYVTAEGYIDSERCFYYIKPSGEIAWLFSNSPKSGRQIDWNQPPIGPIRVDPVKFKITVLASPADGGTVSISPSGMFRYKENATLTAVPGKDWAVASVEYSPRGINNVEIGKTFKVTSDMTITVNFIKKDDETAPEHTGSFLGTKIPPKDSEFYGKKEWEIPVYAEIGQKGSTENPYGADNYGFLVLMYDPSVKYVSAKEDLSCNFFAVPLKISGFQKDNDGKMWMVVDGGSVSVANISAGDNPLSQMMFGAMIGSSGLSTVTTKPRHYRIEMLDIDSKTGEFTFGSLQTYSSKDGGWVAGGANELTNTKKGAFAKHKETGYPADMFEGVRMKTSPRRNDVLWYPPQSWFDNKTLLEKTIESMQEGYQKAKSDYEQIFEKK